MKSLLTSVNGNSGLKSFKSLVQEEGLILQDRSNESVDDAIASITENL
jgi:hypothetical protein